MDARQRKIRLTINLGGRDRENLFRRFDDIGANVRFERATRPSLSGVISGLWSIRFPQHFPESRG
jgi:hypothetical protein